MEAEIPGEEEEGDLRLDDIGEVEKYGIFARFHNSIVGHLGAERTLKAVSLGGHGWSGMRQDIVQMISECPICQKLKFQREPNWEDAVDHHLYSLDPLTSLSVSVERGRIGRSIHHRHY